MVSISRGWGAQCPSHRLDAVVMQRLFGVGRQSFTSDLERTFAVTHDQLRTSGTTDHPRAPYGLYARVESPDLTIPYHTTRGGTGKVGPYYERWFGRQLR